MFSSSQSAFTVEKTTEITPGMTVDWVTQLPLPGSPAESCRFKIQQVEAVFRLYKEEHTNFVSLDGSHYYFTMMFEPIGDSLIRPGFCLAVSPILMTEPPCRLIPYTVNITNEDRVVWRAHESALRQRRADDFVRMTFYITYQRVLEE